MRIEDEIKQPIFRDEFQKAHINLLYTAGWLQLRQTVGLPRDESASCKAAQTAWMPAPPPSPMPFAPSGVYGDGDSR